MFSFLTGTRTEDTDFVAPRFMGMSDFMGITDQDKPTTDEARSALQGKFYACLRMRADAVANAIVDTDKSAGFEVVRETGQGEWEPVEESHPWLSLLRRPNEHRPAYEAWYWAAWAYDLMGKASFIVGDGPGRVPDTLLEVFPEFGEVQPLQSPDGGVRGWVYVRSDGERVPLEPRDVIQVANSDPMTPYEGMSLVEVLAYQIDQEAYADIYARRTLKDGRPPLLQITFSEDIGIEEANKFGEEFRRKFMEGSVKGVPVFGKGGRVEGIGINPKEFQMLEQRGLNQALIHDVTGVPEALFKQGSNRAEAEQAHKTFLEQTIQPLATRLAAQLTHGFRRAFGADDSLRIVAPDVVPVDRKAQEELNLLRLKRGVTVNEIKRENGEEEVEGGDEPMIDASVVPLGSSGLM